MDILHILHAMISETDLRDAVGRAVRARGISRVAAQAGVATVTLKRIMAGRAMADSTTAKVLRWCAQHASDARLRESAAAEIQRREARRYSVPLPRRDIEPEGLYGASWRFKGSGS